MAGNPNLPTENIDEVILRLLALEPNEVDELDYETYSKYLRELLTEISAGRKIDSGEAELIQKEFKRVRGKKGRFRIVSKKSKVTATGLGLGGIRKQAKVTQQRIMLMPVGGIPKGGKDVKEKVEKVSKKKKTESDPLLRISKTLDSILRTLTDINKENRKRVDRERRDSETRRRGGRERDLESKRFDGIKKALSVITKPFQSIWDRIVQFITNVVLGRIVLKLLDWFADPNNQGKINSIIRFFSDHWPTLLALYLRFGTGIGRFVGKLTGFLIKGAIKLGALTARLLASAGLKKFGAAAKFLGGPRGKLLGAGLSLAATVGGTLALGKGIESLAGGDKEEAAVPQFSGGGWNKGFGNMFSGAKNFFGNMFSGLVKGPKGRDKVPAMLTDGEFVMSAGAVRKYGVDTLESMNAAGGGTNIPQIQRGVTYAAGGGYIGDYMSGQVKLRPATIREMAGDSQTLRNLLGVKTKEEAAKIVRSAGNKVPDVEDLIGKKEFIRLQQGAINKFSEGADEKTFKGLRRIYQQHFGVGEEFSKMMSNRVDAEMLRRSSNPTSTPKSKVTRIDPSRMLPAAGESSANAMRAAAKAAQNVRAPIPATSAIVPYTGGGLAKTGVTAGLSVPEMQQIRTNMNVPGGRSGRGGIVGSVLMSLAEIFKPQIQAAVGELYDKMGIGLGNLSNAELKKQLEEQTKRVKKLQSGPMGQFMDGGAETERLQFLQQEANKRKLAGLKGGAIKGGYGLKEQSFKDAPKTMVMTDEKGKPFVGYKAMRSGKLVYVRGPQPGMGTSNPLEMLGRAINPGAYKDVDAANARKKYQEASAESIASLKSRGASQATIARRQAELKKGVKPLPKPQPKPYVAAGGGMGGRRGSGSSPSTGSKPPSFSPTHSKGTRTAQATLGIKK